MKLAATRAILLLSALGFCPHASAQATSPAKTKPEAKQAEPAAKPVAPDDEEHKPSVFLRLTKDDRGNPLAMETAVVRYVPEDCGQTSPTVELVAAVHIADKGYFRELNERFKKYEVVLYELVAPEGTRVPKGGGAKSDNPVSAVQKGMTQLLDLSFQLNEVDYTPKRFVHADMSPDQLSKAMKDRGESLWTILLRSMGYALAKQGQKPGGSSDADLLMALFDKDRAMALKRVMAEQFEDMDGMMKALDGPDGSSLIAGRNQAALEVLKKQLAEGKKKVAIFYGAGHMADMEKRLRDDFGLVPVNTEWVKAWDLKGPKKVEGKKR